MDLLSLSHDASGPFAGIYTLTLEQPGKPVVVLDHDLIRRLEATIKSVPSSCRGLVLRSASERVFVAGADLKAIMELDDAQLEKYLAYGSHVFGLISQLKCPTAAAINGAALGGGLELAMHCDALIAAPAPARDGQPAKPYPVGLPEAGLKICPGWGGTNLLGARIDPQRGIAATMTGATILVDEARSLGLFDQFAPSAQALMDTAKAWVAQAPAPHRDGAPLRWIGRTAYLAPGSSGTAAAALAAFDTLRTLHQADLATPGPIAAVLDAVNAGLARGWQAALESERRHLIQLRGTPAGRDAIAGFFAKAAGKK